MDKRLQGVFRMPTLMKITGRSPSITNAFTNSIIPLIEPNFEDVKTVLEILEMDESSVQCSYCGDPSSEWDHFRPLIVDKKPTGFISEISNLVPSCGKCNQSKGNKNWKDWMLSGAKLSPKSRAITDLQQRIGRLEIFEKWRNPTMINFEDIVGREIWEVHTVHEENVLHAMRTAQQHADVIRSIILRNLEQ